MQLASEPDRRRVLRIIRENLPPFRRVFVGVIDPINPKVETPQEVRNRVLEPAEFMRFAGPGHPRGSFPRRVFSRAGGPLP
jgi:hypothetical protein